MPSAPSCALCPFHARLWPQGASILCPLSANWGLAWVGGDGELRAHTPLPVQPHKPGPASLSVCPLLAFPHGPVYMFLHFAEEPIGILVLKKKSYFCLHPHC